MTGVQTCALRSSAFWLFWFGITGSTTTNEVTTSGDKVVVDPKGGPPVTIAEGVTVGPAGLAIPVAGIKPAQLVDTFTQARAGGARVHDAIDIMAPTGTPVVSVAPGTVEKLYFSKGGGGTSVYIRSTDGRWNYYYAHLNAYAPGLHEGQKVERGTPVGTVGFSGNANPAGPTVTPSAMTDVPPAGLCTTFLSPAAATRPSVAWKMLK